MTKIAGVILACLCLGSAPAIAGPVADVPAPPNAKALGTETLSSGGEEASYSTSANPGAVIESYKQSLAAAGWTVTGSGSSGSSSGGGAGLQATNGPKFLSISAGGPSGVTFVHVCVWPEKPKDDHCGD